MTRAANAANAFRLRAPARWFCGDSIFERLPQHFQDMTPGRREFVQEEHAMVRPRHLAWHRDLTATDPPHSRNSVMGGATRAQSHQGFFRNGSMERGVL
jgi:hypothetical protein